MRTRGRCSSSLSSPQAEIFHASSRIIRRTKSASPRAKSGGWRSRCYMGWRHCIGWTSFIEISRVPICCWARITNKSSWEIWMLARSVRVVLLAPKLALLIMPALKFGLTCLTMANATFGRWVVFFMKWLPSGLRFLLTTFMPSRRRYL